MTDMNNLTKKMMSKMFREVKGLRWGMDGNIGISKDGSVMSLGIRSDEEIAQLIGATPSAEDKKDLHNSYYVEENIMEEMSIDVPGFATPQEVANIKVGDIVLGVSGEILGWAIKIKKSNIHLMKVNGQVTNYVPSKISMGMPMMGGMGGNKPTIMVVQNMFGIMSGGVIGENANIQNNPMAMMMQMKMMSSMMGEKKQRW